MQGEWRRPFAVAASGPGSASCGGGRQARVAVPHWSCTQGDKQCMLRPVRCNCPVQNKPRLRLTPLHCAQTAQLLPVLH